MFRFHRWHVFISHAHEDAATARQLAAHLAARGLSCWLDRQQLRLADPFDDRILDALSQSCVVLVLLSRTAMSKDYVRHEISSALGRNSKIAPYFLEPLLPDELRTPFDFKTLRLHSLSHDTAKPEESFAELSNGLRALTRWCRWPGRLLFLSVLMTLLATGWGVYQMLKPKEIPLAELIERGEPPFPEKPLSASLDGVFDLYGLRTGAQEWVALTNFAALTSGENYFIHAASLTMSSQLYVFTCDAAGKVQWLFPRNDTFPYSTGTNSIASGKGISLPDGPRGYQLDDTVGEERFYAIFSVMKWPQLEHALKRASRRDSSTPLPLPATERRIGFRSRGVAGITTTDVAQPEARDNGGQLTRVTPARLAFRSSQHWMLLTRVLRHVAPHQTDTAGKTQIPPQAITAR